jgi:ACR3 family arsenite efflux pump ArsB
MDANFKEVADRMLDLTEQSVLTITSHVQEMAPELWGLLIKQQYTKASVSLCMPILFLGIFIIVYKMLPIGKWINYDKDDIGLVLRTILKFIVLPFILFMWCVLLYDYLPNLLNPEYYAAKEIISWLK